MNVLLIVVGVLILISCLGVIGFTLMLNTKSEGLGAAVTGASDNYRGAIGVEDQKRKMQRNFSVAFIVLSLVFTLIETYS